MLNWKHEICRDYEGRYNEIGRKAARHYNVPWASCWDIKQKLLSGEFKYEDTVTKPKILLYDIETAPVLAHVWQLFKANVGINQIQADWYMLSWAAKWLGEDGVFSASLPDYDLFKTDKENDTELVKALWQLFDEADFVIGHNVKRFDDKKTKARFLKHGLKPPSSYRIIDTLSIAKKEFAVTSNKLDFLATHLGLKNKVCHEGHTMWTKCMQGDLEAWGNMVEYNEWDVGLLEEVYLLIRPWYQAHPNIAVYYNDLKARCGTCGSDDVHVTESTVKTNTSEYDEYECGNCGKRSRDGFNNVPKEKRQMRLSNFVQ